MHYFLDVVASPSDRHDPTRCGYRRHPMLKTTTSNCSWTSILLALFLSTLQMREHGLLKVQIWPATFNAIYTRSTIRSASILAMMTASASASRQSNTLVGQRY